MGAYAVYSVHLHLTLHILQVEPIVKRSATRLVNKLATISYNHRSVDVVPLCKDFTLEVNIASFFGRSLNLLGDQEGEDSGAVNFAKDVSTLTESLEPSKIALPTIFASEFSLYCLVV